MAHLMQPAATRKFGTLATAILPFALLAALWQLLVQVGVLDPFLTSSPSRVGPALYDLVQSGVLWRHLKVSLIELWWGFSGATVVGILVGVPVGWYRRVEYAVDPFVWLVYSAPVVALYPVFTLVFGLGRPTVIAIAFLLAVPVVVVNTAAGVRAADATLVRAARSFCANDRQIFTSVAIPAALPLIMAGLRLAVGKALIGVIVGEFFAGQAGLGFSVTYYGGLLKTTDMIAVVIVIAALGVLLTQLLGLLERRLDAWRPEVQEI